MRPSTAVAACLLLAAAAAPAADLAATLDAAIGPVPRGGLVGVMVYDLTGHSALYARQPDQPLSLASVTKLAVSGAALWELGTDFRFRTVVVGIGEAADGVLPALGVIGGGSPCFDEHFADEGDADRVFAGWAAALRARGILRIAGDIVIDGSLFSGPIRPDTWPQDAENQQRWYSAPASAFAWNDNCIEVRAVPTRPGQPCTVQVRPPVPLRNQCRTGAPGTRSALIVNRDADGNGVSVGGTIARATDWFQVAIHSDPERLAGERLRQQLIANGVAVGGAVRVEPIRGGGTPLIDVRHELLPALTVLNQRSQNFYGEQLLRLLGVRRAREGSIAAGARALAAILDEHVPANDCEIVDGCGLSYADRASARTLVRLLTALDEAPFADAFRETLKRGLKENEVAGAGRVRVKTGYHAQACNVAGYIERGGGGRVAFALLLNRGASAGIGWAELMRRRLFDALVRAID